jgi:hypothetical protein
VPKESSTAGSIALAAAMLKAMRSSRTNFRTALLVVGVLLAVTAGILAYSEINSRSAAGHGAQQQQEESASPTPCSGENHAEENKTKEK